MLRVGTAGFAYKDWYGPVYPDPKPTGFEPLRFLSGLFPCIEMNTSFYGVPKPASVAKWVDTVRDHDDFRFTFKLYRGLTHGTEDDQLAPFLEALSPCRDAGRLGAILLQLPFFFRNTQPNRARLGWLADGLRGWPCAVEIRDRSWLQPAALDFLRRLDLNICNIDICQTRDSIPPGAWTTGPLGYVRLHGRNAEAWFDKKATVNEKYNYLYSGTELKEWVDLVRRIVAETDSTYVITNNHFGGRAVANGLELLRHLTGDAPAAPPRLRQAFPGLR